MSNLAHGHLVKVLMHLLSERKIMSCFSFWQGGYTSGLWKPTVRHFCDWNTGIPGQVSFEHHAACCGLHYDMIRQYMIWTIMIWYTMIWYTMVWLKEINPTDILIHCHCAHQQINLKSNFWGALYMIIYNGCQVWLIWKCSHLCNTNFTCL